MQESAEAFSIRLFEDANLCAIHARNGSPSFQKTCNLHCK
eukprot:CCRYP_017368-RA/>CCRYP_017368-RA protein AED:0.36 eAED:0.60 QI:0/-1/0/1/-1/0/1/0/39